MTCRHENIFWEDFFKEGKVKDNGEVNNTFQWHDAFCLDCNEIKGERFAKKLQRWYCEKIEEWLINNKLAEKFGSYYYFTDFKKFLKEKNYDHIWEDLKKGKIDEEYFDALGGQMIFQEASTWIENFCRQFKKAKEKEKDDPEREREREREREQISKKNKEIRKEI